MVSLDNHFERERQCEDLYQDYRGHPNACFAFLSPEGRKPATVSEECAQDFLPLSFVTIGACLEEAIRKEEEGPAPAVFDYLNTLREVFPVNDRTVDDKLRFYLRHKKEIQEWARLAERERDAAHQFFMSLEGDFAALAEELGVKFWSNDPDDSYPAFHFYRQAWAKHSDRPVVCVAFEYHRPSATFDSPRTGIWWLDDREKRDPVLHDELERIKKALVEASRRSGSQVLKPERWWAVRRPIKPPPRYWEEEGMPKLRQHLLAEMRGTWERYSDLFDSVMGSS